MNKRAAMSAPIAPPAERQKQGFDEDRDDHRNGTEANGAQRGNLA